MPQIHRSHRTISANLWPFFYFFVLETVLLAATNILFAQISTGHPFPVGVTDPFSGSYANHNIISNLLPGTQIVTRGIPENNPTTVVYNPGSGTVIASGLTLEIAYWYELNGWGYFNFGLDMYPNMLAFMLEAEAVPVSTWALVIGIVLIGGLVILRCRRIA